MFWSSWWVLVSDASPLHLLSLSSSFCTLHNPPCLRVRQPRTAWDECRNMFSRLHRHHPVQLHRIEQLLCCISSLAGLEWRSMDNPRVYTHCNSDETFLLQQMSLSINNELKDWTLCEILISSQENTPLERKGNGCAC